MNFRSSEIDVLVSELDVLVERATRLGLSTTAYLLQMARLDTQIAAARGKRRQSSAHRRDRDARKKAPRKR